jgi:hypothetical protein
MNMHSKTYCIFTLLLSVLCDASDVATRVEQVQACHDRLGAIVVSVDRAVWKKKTKNSRVDIIFERKNDRNSFELVDWRANIDWSKWIRSASSKALIKVSDLKVFDRMTVVVKDGDKTLYSKEFRRHEILTSREDLWDQPQED